MPVLTDLSGTVEQIWDIADETKKKADSIKELSSLINTTGSSVKKAFDSVGLSYYTDKINECFQEYKDDIITNVLFPKSEKYYIFLELKIYIILIFYLMSNFLGEYSSSSFFVLFLYGTY